MSKLQWSEPPKEERRVFVLQSPPAQWALRTFTEAQRKRAREAGGSLPAHWKLIPGTWCDRSGVMEGRCEPADPYTIPPRPVKPELVERGERKEA